MDLVRTLSFTCTTRESIGAADDIHQVCNRLRTVILVARQIEDRS